MSSVFINEKLSPTCSSFLDAVAARFSYFAWVKSRRLSPQQHRISPFVKPKATSVDDLLPAFATHKLDKHGNSSRIELDEVPNGLILQPLVFASKRVHVEIPVVVDLES